MALCADQQLFSINVILLGSGKQVPAVYVLMSHRMEADCDAVSMVYGLFSILAMTGR